MKRILVAYAGGDPARRALDTAIDLATTSNALVSVGSRGLGLVYRLLQGSASEHLATHADATVVIAR